MSKRDDEYSIFLNEIFNNKKNIFISGPGGVGKSFAIKTIAKEAKKRGIVCSVTASTGVAAVNVNGRTIHSWAGVKLAKDSGLQLANLVLRNHSAVKNWRETKILIIDEISMIGKTLFDKLNYVAKMVRHSTKPFGGLILIVCGDFLQLPPVGDDFCFTSLMWTECDFKTIKFSTPYRYDDVDFFNLLLRVRIGQHTDEDVNRLKERFEAYRKFRKIKKLTLSIEPTRLHSLKKDVASYNIKKLNELETDEKFYYSHDEITMFEDVPKRKMSDFSKTLETVAPEVLILKVGAQVMLTYNLDCDHNLANGSRGVVSSMDDNSVIVKFLSGKEVKIDPISWEIENKEMNFLLVRRQIPLCLAWSLTIHKCQGSTLDYCIINLGPSVFAEGQGYVALSRCKNIEGLFINNFIPNSLKTNKVALEFENKC